jgi:hypothetical protein
MLNKVDVDKLCGITKVKKEEVNKLDRILGKRPSVENSEVKSEGKDKLNEDKLAELKKRFAKR